jgi:hypothetical protein
MRCLILLQVILFSSSCVQNTKTIKTEESSSAKELIGEWGIYSTIREGVETNCNVCPIIKFDTNHMATVLLPSGDREKIQWRVKDNQLILTALGRTDIGRIFSDSLFEMTFTEKKEFTELELRQIERRYSKILRQ